MIGLFVLLGFVSFGNEVSAECGGVSCAAVCRYSCEVSDRPAGCTDAQFDAKAQACCEAAFQNTPGIDQVPCTVGPDDV